MKKLLAVLTSLAMVASLAACSNGDGEGEGEGSGSNSESSTTPTTTPAPEVDAEPIPDNPLIYLSFDDETGLTSMENTKSGDTITGLTTSDHPILIAEGQGAVGNALYLDGKYGVDFDMVRIDDDVYTISFWYNADRFPTQFGPIVQVGRNLAGEADPVTWINFTRISDSTGWGTPDIAPVLWNRNSSIGTEVNADGVWPWLYAMDEQEHGKREWCLVTVVVDGNRYVADDGMERIATKLYIDGTLMWDANAENMYYQGVAPEIFAGDGLEGHIGVNYWDTSFKGFIDEFYVFNEALTAGQVKSLFEAGNPPATPVAPEYDGGDDDTDEGDAEPEPLPDAPVDSSAIDTLGTPSRELGWWVDTTDGYELADGATLTMKLNNYSSGVSNWHNFVVAFSNTEVTTDKLASADNYAGYAEYAVIRADAYGWGDASYNATFEQSWTDWAAWLSLMTEAKVELVITRSGGEVTINFTFTGADGTVMTEKAVVTSTMTASSPVYVHLSGESAYIELLSVE